MLTRFTYLQSSVSYANSRALAAELSDFEEKSCRIMAPGPKFRVTPDVLKNLQLLDFSAELEDMVAVSVAAKSRIFR